MSDINQLAERHIREHEARLKYIDELMDKVESAAQVTTDSPEVNAEFSDLKQERGVLAANLDELRQKTAEEWEEIGPMVLWDIVADRLEKLVERIKH